MHWNEDDNEDEDSSMNKQADQKEDVWRPFEMIGCIFINQKTFHQREQTTQRWYIDHYLDNSNSRWRSQLLLHRRNQGDIAEHHRCDWAYSVRKVIALEEDSQTEQREQEDRDENGG